MDFIIEFLVEIFLEGILEIGMSKRVSKCVRYPLLFFIVLVYMFLIVGLFVIGLKVIDTSIVGGMFVILLDILLFVLSIVAFRKKVKEYKNN